MNRFCSNCGNSREETYAFCAKCGTKFQRILDEPKPATGDPLEIPKITSAIEQAAGSRSLSLKLIAWISVGLLILGFLISTISKKDSGNSSPVVDESVSEYYVFSANEAIKFWDKSLGVSLNQKDKFSKIIFPSLKADPIFYSAPYYTLLIFPTAEALELDKANFESDVDFYGNGWVACSNIAVVFPSSRQNELSKANEAFCK